MQARRVALVFAALASSQASPNLQAKQPTSPLDQEQCTNRAAMVARTPQGLGVMIENCRRIFPAVRAEGGGYAFFDTVTQKWIRVSSPRLNQNDLETIRKYRVEKRRSDDYANYHHELEQKEIRDYISHLEILNYSFDCSGSLATDCALGGGTLRVQIKNIGLKSVQNISFYYQFGMNLDCNAESNQIFQELVSVSPGSSININHHFNIGEANFHTGDTICVSIAGIGGLQ